MIRLGLDRVRYRERDTDAVPPGFVPVSGLPLLVLVGMTGSGKTTTIGRLDACQEAFLLPERRSLADAFIIPAMRAEGPAGGGEPDRLGRMALTRRFREMHPGGFAYLLSRLWVAAPPGARWCLFDGLRGPEEIDFALSHLERARLAMLDVPDDIRLARLLGRGDRFDTVRTVAAGGCGEALFTDDAPFSREERQRLLAAVPEGTPDGEVRAKIMILAEEKRSYGMERLASLTSGPRGECIRRIDAASLPPDGIADILMDWMQRGIR
jgi:hypothetical protein